jgi:hypothetical protein
MFRPRFGQQLLMAIALGAFFSASTLIAATIPLPHDSTQNIASTSDVNSISIAHSGTVPGATYFSTLDLKNNDLIVQGSDTASAQSNYFSVNDMVQSGFSPSQDWSGKGITSSTANADFNNGPGATGVGVILNDDAQDPNNPSGSPLVTTWDGKTVNQFSTFAKYTFVGDTQLRGLITGFDVGVVLGDFNQHIGGWINGDFFNQGNVTGTDVGVVLANFSAQHQYPFTYPGAVAGGLSVPEPSSAILGVLAIVMGAIMFTRSRRSAFAAK